MAKKWTKADDNWLVEQNNRGQTYGFLARNLRRSTSAVKARLRQLWRREQIKEKARWAKANNDG